MKLFARLSRLTALALLMGPTSLGTVMAQDDYDDAPAPESALHEDLGIGSRLDEIRFPAHAATQQTRSVRERERLYGGVSFLDKQGKWHPGKIHRLGKVTVSPTLEISGMTTDNVYRQKTRPKSDWQYEANPALVFGVPFGNGKHRLGLGLHGRILRSVKEGRHFNDAQWGAFLDGGLHLLDFEKRGSRWRFVVSDAFDHGATPPSRRGDHWHSYWGNTASAVLGYHFGDKWSVDVGYSNLYRGYTHSDDDIDNQREHVGMSRLYYKIGKKTRLFLGYTQSWANRTMNSSMDSTNRTYSMGVQYKTTPKIMSEAEVSYMEKDFRQQKDDHALGYNLAVTYYATKRLTVVVSGGRSLQETHVVDGDDISGPSYKYTDLNLTLDYRLTNRASVTAQAGLGKSDFNGRTTIATVDRGRRDDEYRTVALGLRLDPLSWLALTLEGRHTENNSSVGNFDYEEESVRLTALMTF